MADYYDRQGNAMTLDEWAKSYETRRDQKRVAETALAGGYWVSTVWLGLNHNYGDGPPLIFETMVFKCGADGKVADWSELDSDRYTTEEDALAGHARLVNKWAQQSPQSA